MDTDSLLHRLGIEHPIIAAPMGGGPSTPELVAAVSEAGGMGCLAGAYLTPEQIDGEIRRVRALTGRPFAVNLFAGGYHAGIDRDPAPMLALMREVHGELGLPAPELPAIPPDPFEAQLRVVLDARPAAFSFTFGIPSADAIGRLRAAGIVVLGTATTVEEGRMLADASVDAVIAQGAEAGAHRGTFTGDFDAAMVPTLELTAGIAATGVPVVASGGLMDGRDVAAALAAGAQAVQLGTAFVPCPESGAAEVYKQAILAAVDDRTVVTRAFSGRHARGIENDFIQRMRTHAGDILSFPAQNTLTRPMRAAAAKRGEAGYLSLWAGTGAARARRLPAAELVRVLVDELREAQAAAGAS